MKANLKILVIRFSSIGDIVLTTPVLRCLKTQLKGVEIHFLTKSKFADVVKANPYIDKLWTIDESLDDVLEPLRGEGFDYVIDLHNNLRSFIVRFFLEVPSVTFNKLNLRKWLLVNFKWNVMPRLHVVDRYLATVKRLGVVNDGKGLNYFISNEDRIGVEQLPLTHLHGFVAIAFGAAHNTKSIPYEKLRELCKTLTVPIILLGGKQEREIAIRIENEFKVKVYNACGTLNINQSASVISLAKAVVTADTGLMHIAAAFNKPIVSVWGNTVPDFGMHPYFGTSERSKWEAMEVSVQCRPCSKIGYAKCPRGHFKCMMDHDMNAVPALLNKLL